MADPRHEPARDPQTPARTGRPRRTFARRAAAKALFVLCGLALLLLGSELGARRRGARSWRLTGVVRGGTPIGTFPLWRARVRPSCHGRSGQELVVGGEGDLDQRVDQRGSGLLPLDCELIVSSEHYEPRTVAVRSVCAEVQLTGSLLTREHCARVALDVTLEHLPEL